MLRPKTWQLLTRLLLLPHELNFFVSAQVQKSGAQEPDTTSAQRVAWW